MRLGRQLTNRHFFRPVRDDLKHTLKLIAPMYSTAGFFQVQTFTNHPLLPFYQSLQIIAPFKGLKKGFAARQSFLDDHYIFRTTSSLIVMPSFSNRAIVSAN